MDIEAELMKAQSHIILLKYGHFRTSPIYDAKSIYDANA